jgi:uncharacterized membrane protein YfcA
MIPVLTLLLHQDQHLSQAAAMIVNFFVAAPAAMRHHRARAVPVRAVTRTMPAGLLMIMIGVEASNHIDGRMLMKLFGAFLVYVVIVNVRKLFGAGSREDDQAVRDGWIRCSAVGTIAGFAAGLLGIGGGIIAVPLFQRLCHLPLRRSIAASAAVMCVTSMLGAVRKNLALSDLTDLAGVHLDPMQSLLIAACLAPTAIIGGVYGAGLTHSLPLRWVRLAFVILLAVASVRFLTA